VPTLTFQSKRIARTSSITLNASLNRVFPLVGPIKEKDWATGWDPQIVYSTADVEEHMVFQTRSPHGSETIFTWTVSKYQPAQALIEYTVFTTERMWRITVQCYERNGGRTTEAEITYTYTGLTEQGNLINEKALAAMYYRDLKDWEEAINHYLETGARLEQG
jgi:hypothetical protein